MAEHTRAHATDRFRVHGGISTRKIPDQSCEDWITWEDGQTVRGSTFPEHLDIPALVASGHLEPLGDAAEQFEPAEQAGDAAPEPASTEG